MTDHGGDWAGFLETYGAPPLDFSSNVSPLGVPEPVRRAAEASLAEAGRYPDPLCRALRKALASCHGVPAEWILCGNGAADLIYRLAAARQPKTALVTAPTFSEYENALTLWGCRVSRFPLSEETGFAVTEDILSRITPELDLLFLCEPNNPTGRTTDRRLLKRVLDRCSASGTLLAVDALWQRNGYGTRLLEHWARDMRAQGFRLLLTSTRSDETAQHFYRRLGWRDCGGLLLDLPVLAQPTELFLYRTL